MGPTKLTIWVVVGQMTFLLPNQQCRTTEANSKHSSSNGPMASILLRLSNHERRVPLLFYQLSNTSTVLTCIEQKA